MWPNPGEARRMPLEWLSFDFYPKSAGVVFSTLGGLKPAKKSYLKNIAWQYGQTTKGSYREMPAGVNQNHKGLVQRSLTKFQNPNSEMEFSISSEIIRK